MERGWTKAHREQLASGHDWFHDAWGNLHEVPMEDRGDWPPPQIESEMREAWEHFRDELMAEYADKVERPWGWWKFEFESEFPGVNPNRLKTFGCSPGVSAEAEVLDRLNLLTPKALEDASRNEQLTRGVLNEFHSQVFRRGWGWWRFVSPERRDYSKPEAVQLADIEKRGGEVLTNREQKILAHRGEPADGSCRARVLLDRAEVEALGLPPEFIYE